MKKTGEDIQISSFSGITVLTTYNEIVRQMGEPLVMDHGDDKVRYRWLCMTNDGILFTIYDWKEYNGFEKNENIWWHIGYVRKDSKDRILKELKECFATVKDEF